MSGHAGRAHALLSASSAYRWLVCPPSAHIASGYPDTSTEYAREGTLAHEVAERIARGGQPPEAPGVTAEMVEHARGYAAYIDEQKRTSDAIVLLEQRVDFSAWVPDGFGTCDCIILEGDTLTIIDYKYGQGVPVSAEANPQIRLYALGALHDYGFAYRVRQVEMHIYQPRLDNISHTGLLTEDLLDWAEHTVKPAAAQAADGTGAFKAGEHCRFCPHAGSCPALAARCEALISKYDIAAGVPSLSPEETAKILGMEPLITLWLKRVRERALSVLLEGEAIPGYKVVEGRGSRVWDDEAAVLSELLDAGYHTGDVTRSELLSPAAMEKALGKKRVGELIAAHVIRKPGAPSVAPESDRRPEYDRLAEAKNDFSA